MFRRNAHWSWYPYQGILGTDTKKSGRIALTGAYSSSTLIAYEAVLLGTISANGLSPMKARHLIFLLGLYVSLDLANPFMPGAFNFNPDESVDGVRLHYEVFRSRLAVIAAPPSIGDAALKRPVVTPQPAELLTISEWFVDLRQRQSSPSEPPPPTDDH